MDANEYLHRVCAAFGEAKPRQVSLRDIPTDFRRPLAQLCSESFGTQPHLYGALQIWLEYMALEVAPNEEIVSIGGSHFFLALGACVVSDQWSLAQLAFAEAAMFFFESHASWFTGERRLLLADCLARVLAECRPGQRVPGLALLLVPNTSMPLMGLYLPRLARACATGSWLCPLLASTLCCDRDENPLLLQPEHAPLLWPRGSANGRRWRTDNIAQLQPLVKWQAIRKAALSPVTSLDGEWAMRLGLLTSELDSRQNKASARAGNLLCRLGEATSERAGELWDDELL